jgi:hypothetical protein
MPNSKPIPRPTSKGSFDQDSIESKEPSRIWEASTSYQTLSGLETAGSSSTLNSFWQFEQKLQSYLRRRSSTHRHNMSGSAISGSQTTRRSSATSGISAFSNNTLDSEGLSLHGLLSLQYSHWSRRETHDIITSSLFNTSILIVILLNTIVLAVQTTSFISKNYGKFHLIHD